MRLIKVHITNYRSVEDSGEFSVDHVTCLVGKNEAGKSAVLLALASLNPHPATPVVLDKERDYPRRYLTAYAHRHPEADAVAVTTTWELSRAEIDAVAREFGDVLARHEAGDGSPAKPPHVSVFRRYQAEAPEWEIAFDLRKAIDNVLERGAFDEVTLASLQAAQNTQQLIDLLGKIPDTTEKQKQLLAWVKSFGSITSRITQVLKPFLPTFMYFSNYDRMDGAAHIETLSVLKQNGQINADENKGKRLFQEFLDYAGAPLQEVISVATYETFNARLQAASNNITDQILEYWTQNPDLAVEVKIETARTGDPPPFNAGTVARARIYNHLHRVDTPFSERSAGFVWFFSFLVKFAQVKAEGKPVILLLDEPGLSLHGKAQGDLLRYFDEKLAPHHQIVYSTHSPFMVAPDKLMSARIVEDQVNIRNGRRVPIGTKVRDDVLSRDPDTIFPLQGALGYELTQSLFVGKHTLLVEGPSDILFLQALSHASKLRGGAGLDPRWTLCPSGGIGNIRAFVSLFGGNNLDIAVLADQSKADVKKIEELRRSAILKAGRVLTAAEFTGKTEADIEDLFAPDLFASVINGAYSLPPQLALTGETLNASDETTERLVKKAEAAFRVMPESIPVYDHFSPAAWLIQNSALLAQENEAVKTTLARAEMLFKSVNALLGGH